MSARFLQFHTLTSFPASLLNRDDAGLAKQIPFGGSVRTRISSQCLKRHWRTFEGDHDLKTIAGDMGLSVRSREAFRRKVAQPLIADGLDPAKVEAVVGALMRQALGESAKKAKGRAAADAEGEADAEVPAKDAKAKKDDGDALHTGQIVVLGERELAFVRATAAAVIAEIKDLKKVDDAVKAALGKDALANLKATTNAGLDAAVFGRMVTSDNLARCDAAIHVAHSFTVHASQSEADYFTAMDDLTLEAGEGGSGHINSTDLTTGLFYGYVVVDVDLLVKNLGGDRALAASVVESIPHLIATVSPGAKLGSTAPHSFAHLLLAEAGNRQPCTLANAFLGSVPLKGNLLETTYARLAQEAGDLDANFGSTPARTAMIRGAPFPLPGLAPTSLPTVAAWCADQVR